MPSRLTAFGVTFGIAALMVYVLVTGSDLLIPLAIAIMIWYLINALSRTIEVRLKVPGWLALTLSITALVVALGLIVEMISGNIAAVREAAPTYQANIEKLVAQAVAIGGLKEMPTIGHVVDQVDVRALIGGGGVGDSVRGRKCRVDPDLCNFPIGGTADIRAQD